MSLSSTSTSHPLALQSLNQHSSPCTDFYQGWFRQLHLYRFLFSKLQSILDAASRLIDGLRKLAHISAFIRETDHWLPVPKHIQFKILTLLCNCLVGSASSYVQTLFISALHSLVAPLFARLPEAFWLFTTCPVLLLYPEALLMWAPLTGIVELNIA